MRLNYKKFILFAYNSSSSFYLFLFVFWVALLFCLESQKLELARSLASVSNHLKDRPSIPFFVHHNCCFYRALEVFSIGSGQKKERNIWKTILEISFSWELFHGQQLFWWSENHYQTSHSSSATVLFLPSMQFWLWHWLLSLLKIGNAQFVLQHQNLLLSRYLLSSPTQVCLYVNSILISS